MIVKDIDSGTELLATGCHYGFLPDLLAKTEGYRMLGRYRYFLCGFCLFLQKKKDYVIKVNY
jgi:hypothetical protein